MRREDWMGRSYPSVSSTNSVHLNDYLAMFYDADAAFVARTAAPLSGFGTVASELTVGIREVVAVLAERGFIAPTAAPSTFDEATLNALDTAIQRAGIRAFSYRVSANETSITIDRSHWNAVLALPSRRRGTFALLLLGAVAVGLFYFVRQQ